MATHVDEFVELLTPMAVEIGQRYGIDPALIITQAAIETGWGSSVKGNNYFGVKSHGQPGGQQVMTHEEVNGRLVPMYQDFRKYDGLQGSMEDYAKFLSSNPRYSDVFRSGNLDSQIKAIADAGYATDSSYGQKMRDVSRMVTRRMPPVPPRDIPNVVASQLDVQRPTPLPTPVTERRMTGTSDAPTSALSRAYPTLNATPRLGNGGIFAYSAPDMQPAQITPGLGSLTPDFFSRPAQIDPVGLGPQSLATVQDMYGRPPLLASVPLPKPRPAMGGDPGGGTMSLPIASLPTTRVSLPAIPSRATDTAPRPTQAQIRADNGQTSQRMSGDTRGGGVITPVATIPTTRQAAATPAPASNVGRAPTTRVVQSVPVASSLLLAAAAPAAPVAPAAVTPIQAQRAEQLAMRNAVVSRPIVQPTAAQVEAATGLRLPNMAAQPVNVPKDQSRLAAGVLPAASAVPLAAAPQIQVGPAPRAITGYPTPVANRPPPLMAQVATPVQRPALPIAAQAPAPMRVSVNGANSYSAPSPTYVTTQTGKQAVAGSSYTGSDGYNYRVESDGTITNTKSGSNSGTWYNPDTNKFERR